MRSAVLLSAAVSAAAAPFGYVTFLPVPGRKWTGEVKGGGVLETTEHGVTFNYDWLASDPKCNGKQTGCTVKLHSGTCKKLGVGLTAGGAKYTTDKSGAASGEMLFTTNASAQVVFASVTSAKVATVYDSTGAAVACGQVLRQPIVRKSYPKRTNTNAEPPRFNPRRAKMHREMKATFDKCEEERRCPYPKAATGKHVCTNNKVSFGGDTYDCKGVDLLSFVPASDLGSAVQGNDIWGWVDPVNGNEIAVHCLRNSASFIDVTDAENPVVLAWMAGTRNAFGGLQSASWRDAKVYKDHAFIGADSISNHGLQVFDLTRLRQYYGRKGSVVPEVEPDTVYTATGFGPSHNIVINEETGFLYSVGTRSYRGGPHVLDISDPKNPQFVVGFDGDSYTHDAECVIYRGPDARYQGKEICFCYNEDTLTILDVSEKDNIEMLSRVPYRNNYYTHQGWLTQDQSHLLLNDELDEESSNEKHTRTLQWNVEDLTNPLFIGTHIATEMSIDHNLYIRGNKAFMSNYCSGLRVLDVTDLAQKKSPEVAFFDVAPYCDTQKTSGVSFQGTWSNYPFFPSGNVILNSIELGLFVLRVQDGVMNATRAH
eukprot:Hpha_TRINITY_DN16477_c0_g3::TRINITY_DN16477_c0_g3_i1::g.159884::m.159884